MFAVFIIYILFFIGRHWYDECKAKHVSADGIQEPAQRAQHKDHGNHGD